MLAEKGEGKKKKKGSTWPPGTSSSPGRGREGGKEGRTKRGEEGLLRLETSPRVISTPLPPRGYREGEERIKKGKEKKNPLHDP